MAEVQETEAIIIMEMGSNPYVFWLGFIIVGYAFVHIGIIFEELRRVQNDDENAQEMLEMIPSWSSIWRIASSG